MLYDSMASELSKGAGELECVDTLAVCFGIDPYGVLKLGKMKLVLLLISTSAARALWTGTRRVRAVSKGTLGSSTPYPEQCPWTGVRQCMHDRDCQMLGPASKTNPCTKCHIGSGSTLNICGPP